VYMHLSHLKVTLCETKFSLVLFYHQMAPRDCRALAGSLLGFLATRVTAPRVTIDVFSNMFRRLTNLTGKTSLCVSFIGGLYTYIAQWSIHAEVSQ